MTNHSCAKKWLPILFREVWSLFPRTAFYRVYVDFGEGEKYFGLYSLVEEVDDTVIKTQYADSKGNLYKPEGTSIICKRFF